MSLHTRKEIEIIGAAFGLGAAKPDTARAPEALRRLGIIHRLQKLGLAIHDSGDVHGAIKGSRAGDSKTRHLQEVAAFIKEFHGRVGEIYSRNRFPVVIGGDHSISLGSVPAALMKLRMTHGPNAKLGLLWVDTHPDLNTPDTTPSGNIHGMSVAGLLGIGDEHLTRVGGVSPVVTPDNVVFIGLRDVDPPERDFIKAKGIRSYTMKDIDLRGIGVVAEEAFSYLSSSCDGFVLSFDLDVVDPKFAPGVGTPVRGGLTLRESHLVMELAAEAQKLMAVEVVELNPLLDPESVTADLAISLVESALGKSIL